MTRFLLLLPFALLAAGIFYQRAGAARDRRRHRPPGRFCSASGSKLHVQSAGEGSPPVILEAGIAASSLSWSLVQPQIAKFTQVVSYDRSGLGWSEPCLQPRTPAQILAGLHTVVSHSLVHSTGTRCVLVGHSFGGLIVRLYATRFPENVAGLVLVDPALTGEWAEPNAHRRQMLKKAIDLSRRGALLCHVGVVRFALAMLTRGSRWLPKIVNRASSGRGASVTERLVGEVRKLPAELWPTVQSHWSRPECFQSMAQHLAVLPEVALAATSAGPLGDLPVIVISGAHCGKEALQEHAALARLSSRGRHRGGGGRALGTAGCAGYRGARRVRCRRSGETRRFGCGEVINYLAVMKTSTARLALFILCCGLCVSQAATVTIFATDGKNVSDNNFENGLPVVPDGVGDQVSLDLYPWIGAGINLSGAAGQNGTARFQLEFDLTGVTLPIVSALLVLDSDPSPNNTLDTEFFHVTSNEEGDITNNDFQSIVVSTGIVQSPVLVPATYQYDVTTYVQQDLLAGFDFTSYQGRLVDENAGVLFLRGMEYFSSIVPNGDQRPRLIIETAVVPEPSTALLLAAGLVLLAVKRR